MELWNQLPQGRRRLLMGIVGGFVLVGGTAVALRPPLFWRRLRGAVYAPGGRALAGHDPVAFFEDGGPRPGSPAHHFRWRDADWQFASADHRDRFAAAPERYAPAYGGFCALGIARGYRAAGEPDLFTLAGDRLYLNQSRAVQRLWRADMANYVARADQMWTRLRTLA